jgi:uncharacterized protein YbjT (DUF2867 family)
MAGRTALIAGATGLVGTYCLRLLLASPEYSRVIAVVRHRMPVNHPNFVQQVIDFERLGEVTVSSCDDVFCALGTTIRKAGSKAAFRKVDLEYSRLMAEAGLRSGAQRFMLVSSVGADPNSRNFYLRTKGELEQALATLPYSAVHILRPSLLLGTRSERRFGEGLGQAVMPLIAPLMRGEYRKYRAIPAETVAAAMVYAAGLSATGVHVYEYDEIKRFGESRMCVRA